MTLTEYLARNGMPQADFAQRIGTSQAVVSRWVRGERMPATRFLRRIAEVTNGSVTANDVLAAYRGMHRMSEMSDRQHIRAAE